jgi:hypothetical protein
MPRGNIRRRAAHETRDRWLSYDSTVRRSVAQVGRNEPCPCGSGRKYKHCCIEKDRERLRDSTDIARVTQHEIEAAPERILTPARMDAADIYDVQKFDPLKLSPPILERYFRRLTEFRLYDRFAESLEKTGYSDPLDGAWNEAVHNGAKVGRKDIAQRLIDVRKRDGFTEDQLPLGSNFLMIEDDPEKCLAFIEDTVRKALQSEDLNASNEAVNDLRRELQQMQIKNEELEQKPGDTEIDREEELLLEAEAQGTQPVRIIEFSRDFQQRLNNAPRQVAGSAMVMLGRLAGGEAAAFVGAVRLKACPAVMRHRIGIDWRLLFRLLPDRVDAVDLIPRQDLERRIKTLVTQYM